MRERVYDPTHPQHLPPDAYVVPAGVMIMPRASLLSFQRDGLYPERKPEFCCFTASNVTVRVLKPSKAHDLQAVIYVPKWPLFEKRPQNVAVFVGRERRSLLPLGDLHGLGPGVHRLRWSLPVSLAGSDSRFFVRLHSGVSAVPEHEGISSDKRALGFVLIAIRFQ